MAPLPEADAAHESIPQGSLTAHDKIQTMAMSILPLRESLPAISIFLTLNVHKENAPLRLSCVLSDITWS